MIATITIDYAGPYVSIQDNGRQGYMRFGVPRSGPMDRLAFEVLRRALGGNSNFCAIEVSVAGTRITCNDAPITAGVVGGKFCVSIDGIEVTPWSVFELEPGAKLTVRGGDEGSWAYLGFAGDLDVPSWLGSRSTYLYSGLCGRPLKEGDILSISKPEVVEKAHGELSIPSYSRYWGGVRVVLGPQESYFSDQATKTFQESEFLITPDFNRMGMKLDGKPLTIKEELSMPSEALVPGSVQVMGGGEALVLMADHQTTGGYPKIATVVSTDINQLAQARPGDSLRFKAVSVAKAVSITRKARILIDSYLDRLPSSFADLSTRQ